MFTASRGFLATARLLFFDSRCQSHVGHRGQLIRYVGTEEEAIRFYYQTKYAAHVICRLQPMSVFRPTLLYDCYHSYSGAAVGEG